MTAKKTRILIIDDDQNLLDSLQLNFSTQGIVADTADCGFEGLKKFSRRHEDYAVCLIDFHLPDIKGHELVKSIHKIHRDANIIVLSGDGSVDVLDKSLNAGAVYFCEKGDINQLERLNITVQNFCRKFNEYQKVISASEAQTEQETIKIAGMIGQSQNLSDVAQAIQRFSQSDASVLIQGETGTGKEVVARALHQHSKRADKPFVAVNCGAIPKELMESELFGHVKGAFTGAVNHRTGKLLSANGGVLFLDEIGDMPLDLQVKLLRVLQERAFEPVGSNKTVQLDVRVVCATHVNLEESMRQKTFREDLFYRLNVLRIELDPLRERTEDIAPLVAHFAKNISKEHGVDMKFLSSTLNYLKNYAWPGNVRELYNFVESMIVSNLGQCQIIEPKHLPEKFFQEISHLEAQTDDLAMTYQDFRKQMSLKEYSFLQSHLKNAKSLRSAAADQLKMSHTSLLTRLKSIEKSVDPQDLESVLASP